jgi:hypothetical protein
MKDAGKFPDLGESEKSLGLNHRTKPLRNADHMFGTSWQLFAPNGNEPSERVDILVPDEITLVQLIVNCIYPH